jgi:DNA (cytosine-5)-methyltransferase 1
MLRVISEIRPSWVVGENVVGIVSMELDQVLSDLEAQNYTVQAFIIPACAVDAPHRRDRCVIVGHTDRQHEAEDGKVPSGQSPEPSRGGFLAHTYGEGLQIRRHKPEVKAPITENRVKHSGDTLSDPDDRGGTVWRGGELQAAQDLGKIRPDHGGGTPEYGLGGWWATEPDVGRVAYGISHRVDRLKGLGNAVVPPMFFPIFQAIYEIEKAPDA